MSTPSPFHETRFETNLATGVVGGPGFHTTITGLSSGFERRNVDWLNTRGEWTVPLGAKPQREMVKIIKFFYARRGMAYGFRLKDWVDYQCPFWDVTPGDIDPLPTFFTTDTTTAVFQLTKLYDDPVAPFYRTIRKPVSGTLVLKDNGVTMTLTTDYTIDYTTGNVTLSNGKKALSGHLITGYYEFDVPVRLNVDKMDMSAITAKLAEWNSIPLVEVRV